MKIRQFFTGLFLGALLVLIGDSFLFIHRVEQLKECNEYKDAMYNWNMRLVKAIREVCDAGR